MTATAQSYRWRNRGCMSIMIPFRPPIFGWPWFWLMDRTASTFEWISTSLTSTYAIRSVLIVHVTCSWVVTIVQLIETAARERFNDSVALVIRAVLKATEAKQLSVSDIRSGANFPNICVLPYSSSSRSYINGKHCNAAIWRWRPKQWHCSNFVQKAIQYVIVERLYWHALICRQPNSSWSSFFFRFAGWSKGPGRVWDSV